MFREDVSLKITAEQTLINNVMSIVDWAIMPASLWVASCVATDHEGIISVDGSCRWRQDEQCWQVISFNPQCRHHYWRARQHHTIKPTSTSQAMLQETQVVYIRNDYRCFLSLRSLYLRRCPSNDDRIQIILYQPRNTQSKDAHAKHTSTSSLTQSNQGINRSTSIFPH